MAVVHKVKKEWPVGLIELTAGVFAYVQPTGESGVSNAGLLIGDHAATLIDTLMVASLNQPFIEAVNKATPLPIVRIIHTHHHIDHIGGDSFFPQAEVLAHKDARERILKSGLLKPVFARFMPRFAGEFDRVEIKPPTVAFEHDLTLYLGNREIRLIVFGPAHTPGDVGVYLPQEKILFAGDIAFFYVSPLAHEGTLKGWLRACERILAMDVETIVPGHGPIGTKEDLRLVRDYILLIQQEGGKALDEGYGPLEAGKKVNLGPYKEWREWPRALVNVYRWDLERKNQLDAPLDIALYMKIIEELEKMKVE
ncbi:MAG: MBL fold metallo-hydrolase [Deltaproteobacteria bacterium]|nr:MBL fold metallo-hydrolase [Deltaproteobacteria bacterium]